MLNLLRTSRSGAKHVSKRNPLARLAGIVVSVALAAASLLVFQPPVIAAGITCPTTAYLPATTNYPENIDASAADDKYLEVNNVFYKLNKTTGEANAVSYVRTFTGDITIPENLTISQAVIQTAGFDSTTANCQAFAKTYKVRYIGPTAFAAAYNRASSPVLRSITIEAQLKSIAKYAFSDQCLLESLVIPDSVTDIGEGAIASMDYRVRFPVNTNCSSVAGSGLKSVTLGVNLKRLYNAVFDHSQQLNSVVFRGEPLSTTPGSYPSDYDLWGTGNIQMGTFMQNECQWTFSYINQMSLAVLTGTASSWNTWAATANCFAGGKTVAANVTTPPAQMSAPVASNATQNTANVAFTAPTSNGGSTVTSYLVTSVPGGRTATLSGATAGTVTVTGLSAATAYKFNVVAINANGTSSTSSLSNEVTTSALTAPNITLSSATESATAGQAITGYTVSNSGGAIASYSISPTIENGLSFSTATGLISGQPAAVALSLTYTITATNTAGTDTATFSITVVAAPPSVGGSSGQAPSTPIGLAADPAVTTAVISWSSQSGVAEYQLFLGSATSPIATVTGNCTELTGLKKNTKYTASLIAVNVAGQSAKATIGFTTDNLLRISIYFAGDRSVIVKSQAARLNSFLSKVPDLAKASVSIVGGVKKTIGASTDFDRKLAEARAKSVFNRLKLKGAKTSSVILKSTPATKSLDSERKAVLEVVYPNS